MGADLSNSVCTGCPVCYRGLHWSSGLGQQTCLECGWAEGDGMWDRPMVLDGGSFSFVLSIVWRQYQNRATDYEMLPDQGYWEVAELGGPKFTEDGWRVVA